MVIMSGSNLYFIHINIRYERMIQLAQRAGFTLTEAKTLLESVAAGNRATVQLSQLA